MEHVVLNPFVHYIHADESCGGVVVPFSAAPPRQDEETGRYEDLHRCQGCGMQVWVEEQPPLEPQMGTVHITPRASTPQSDDETEEVPF